jgi:hypothetical protein
MIELKGKIFEMAFQDTLPNLLLITTNGCWNEKTKTAIMGAGIAKAAKEMFPDSPKNLGTILSIQFNRFKEYENEPWNIPYKIANKNNTHVFSFPTKPTRVLVTETSILPKFFSRSQLGKNIEGWKARSPLWLVERSAKFIAELVGESPSFIEQIFLPHVGCDNGGLDWETQVKPVLDKYMDDRYTVVERK